MRGGLGTSGKSGSSPKRWSSGLFSTDQRRQSLSRASTDVVEGAAAVDVGNGVVVVERFAAVVNATGVVNTAVEGIFYFTFREN